MAVTAEALRQLIEMEPEDTMLRFALGQKLLDEHRGDPSVRSEAIAHLRFVRDHDRKNIAGWYLLAQALVEAGESEEALRTLTEGLDIIASDGSIDGTDLEPAMTELREELED